MGGERWEAVRRKIGVYNTITVGADIIRPQPYRMDSARIHREYSKTGTFRADTIRPYGGNAMYLKTSNTILSRRWGLADGVSIAFFCREVKRRAVNGL